MPDFTHLHTHSDRSIDGVCSPEALVQAAKAQGFAAIAITDHGTLAGTLAFYQACQKEGVKPILGIEAYITQDHLSRRGREDQSPAHLILLAKNEVGWRNLLRLSSIGSTEGFYYKPRIDPSLLVQHYEGLICLSACPAGELARALADGEEAALAVAGRYRELFGPDYFVEVQSHELEVTQALLRQAPLIAHKLGLPLVATNDVHFVKPDQWRAQELLLKARARDRKALSPIPSLYLRSALEMEALFTELPDAVRNTQVIAERCELTLTLGVLHLPRFEVPSDETPMSWLTKLARRGLVERYSWISPKRSRQLSYELGVIQRAGFATYLLIVHDIIRHARSRGIVFNLRGSAAGSLVCHALGFSDLDPQQYGLLFERFLNPDRIAMPDIDLDFQDDRREEMVQYVKTTYGDDHVAQIATLNTLGARAAIRDAGRALEHEQNHVDATARLVLEKPGITLEEALGQSTVLAERYQHDEQTRQLIDAAKLIEGRARGFSTHAAGIVIAAEPITNLCPIMLTRNGQVQTQFDMEDVETLGLLKVDFLALDNLTTIDRCVKLVAAHRGIVVNVDSLPVNDPGVYHMLAEGHTVGVFQLESQGITEYVRQLRPENLDDLAAMVALYRPGPIEQIPKYIATKHGRQSIEVPHIALEPIVRRTYGTLVYQEQIMEMCQVVAGYTRGEADIVRKGIAKKIQKIINEQGEKFVERASQRGFTPEEARHIWDFVVPFARYSFNLAHACSYGRLAYVTAYLKHHYPAEFITAYLSSARDQDDLIRGVGEARRFGILVLGPDVNHSLVTFTLEGKAIRWGLGGIKGIGNAQAEKIAQGQPYHDLLEFCRRVELSKTQLESLAKVGALPWGNRRQVLAQLPGAKQMGRRTQYQLALFSDDDLLALLDAPNIGELAWGEILAAEEELLGIALSPNPVGELAQELGTLPITQLSLGETEVVGLLTSRKPLMTKKGQPMLVGTVRDDTGTLRFVVFPTVLGEMGGNLPEGPILHLTGKLQLDDREQRNFVVHTARALQTHTTLPLTIPVLTIRIDQSRPEELSLLIDLVDLILQHPGPVPITLALRNGSAHTDQQYGIDLSNDVECKLAKLTGGRLTIERRRSS